MWKLCWYLGVNFGLSSDGDLGLTFDSGVHVANGMSSLMSKSSNDEFSVEANDRESKTHDAIVLVSSGGISCKPDPRSLELCDFLASLWRILTLIDLNDNDLEADEFFGSF